jgi:phage baseplate assembly protein gpV
MFRLGKISELGTRANKRFGYARVYFDDADFVSHWLPLPSLGTLGTKHWVSIEVNTQVLCLMDAKCEQGAILIALWGKIDKLPTTNKPPEWASDTTVGVQFPDGSEMFYDFKAHTLTVNAPAAELNIKCKKLNVDGEVNVTGEVTAGATKIKLSQHKHTSSASGTPTSPPTPAL